MAVLALASSSCNPGEDNYSSQFSDFGTFTAGGFTSDSGESYSFNADQTDKGWTTAGRYYVEYQYTKNSGKDPVRTLLFYSPVRTKEPLYTSETTAADYGADPVWPRYYSISGTPDKLYLNLIVYFYAQKGSDTAHVIDLVVDDSGEASANVSTSLHHNGNGEVLGAPEADASKLAINFGFVSFPLESVLKGTTSSSAKVTISYGWHAYETETNSYTGEVEEDSMVLNIVR